MSNLYDFLVEHAKFPFPVLELHCVSSGTADISTVDAGSLKSEWKAKVAVRDNDLFQKLCRALERILEAVTLTDDEQDHLLASFSPQIQFYQLRGEQRQDRNWSWNLSEACVSVFWMFII